MAMTLAEASIIAAGTTIAAGGTEATPVAAGVGNTVGPFADYAASFAWRLANSNGALGAPATIVFYVSAGGRLYEVDRVSIDTNSGSNISGAIPCPPGFPYATAKVFGNTTNGVTAEVYLERQVP
jgi:hypothetical protein